MISGLLVIIVAVWIIVFAVRRATAPADDSRKEGTPQITPSELTAVPLDHARSWAQLPSTGREVFFPKVAQDRPLYELTFSGVLRSENGRSSDAFYRTDDTGNFSWGSSWIRINGSERYTEFVAVDRFTHRYTVHFRHYSHERLTIAIEHSPGWHGSLIVEATVLAPGTLTQKERRDQEHERRVAEEAARKAKTLADEKFAAVIRSFFILSRSYRNWESLEYRQKYAEAHTEELIRDQAEIRAEASNFLSQRDVLRYFQDHDPAVVQRLTGRLQALVIAERVSLEKHLAKPAPAPVAQAERPKPKLNAEQVRRAKLWRQQRDMEDKLTLVKDKIAREQQTRAWILAQYPDLAEDEQQAMYHQVLEHLYQDDQNGEIL